MNDFASFDTPEDPGGASIVERKDFQAKWPLCFRAITRYGSSKMIKGSRSSVFPWFRWRDYSNKRKVYENQTNSMLRVHLGTLFSFHALYLKGDLASSAKVPYSWTWTPTDVRCLMEIDSSHAMTISSRPVGRFSNPGGPIKSIPPVFKISLYETPLSGIITLRWL